MHLSNDMRTYQVTITDIAESCEMSLMLFLCTYATSTEPAPDIITCTCTPPVLASLIFLFMESELECNITYRKL